MARAYSFRHMLERRLYDYDKAAEVVRAEVQPLVSRVDRYSKWNTRTELLG